MKPKLLIIGSSLIVNEHIKSALRTGFDLYSLNSTNPSSINEKKFYKNYKFLKKFRNWKDALKSAKKNKNIAILLAPRIKDNVKILEYALNGKNFIFTEKPISQNLNDLRKLLKFNNRIFIGYNRIFYKNIRYLKKVLKSPSSIIIKFTENKFKNIYNNSIHVISVVNYLFGDIKIVNKIKRKNSITLLMKDKKGTPINFIFSEKSSESFSIDILENEKRYLIKPLEKLSVYEKLKFKYINGNKKMLVPIENPKKIIDEYSDKKFKPGFLEQMKTFKKFSYNKKKIKNDLNFGLNVIKLCNNFF